MGRRQSKNRTGIPRIEGVPYHDAWASFVCLKCGTVNLVQVGVSLTTPEDAYDTAKWVCRKCTLEHSNETDLPFPSWPKAGIKASHLVARRFWHAFFRSATEQPESYWKQCNACGRVLPFHEFSRHEGWGPLERQMECRSCKAAINADLNPKRTKEQLHEGSVRRRVADMLLQGENERISHKELFKRFNASCFKTGKTLDMKARDTWAIDHIMPSKYLYPLTVRNAALLCQEANENKRDRWPSKFYSNTQLIRLARLTGADISLLCNPTPIINPNIDVNACVSRVLQVREHSNLAKRIANLKTFLKDYGLVSKLSRQNKTMLGYT